MTHPPLTDVPVRSAAELTERWVTVLDPPVFGARSLWLTWFDPDWLQLPVVVPLDELPARPDVQLLRGISALHDTVVDQTGAADGHLALALCRPGPAARSASDDEWADALDRHLDGVLGGTWSLHLAAAGQVLPLISPPPSAWG